MIVLEVCLASQDAGPPREASTG